MKYYVLCFIYVSIESYHISTCVVVFVVAAVVVLRGIYKLKTKIGN
jgi:hypothetical protein